MRKRKFCPDIRSARASLESIKIKKEWLSEGVVMCGGILISLLTKKDKRRERYKKNIREKYKKTIYKKGI